MAVVKVPADDRDESFTQMVAQYQQLLLKLCYVYLCDAEQARDAVQETFLKAYKGLESFRGECSEKTWLIQIARNTCRDMRRSAWLRHTDRRITPEELPGAALIDTTGEELELTAAVMRLPVKLKDVVLLYYYQNMSVVEIAQMLGIAQSTVSGRLSRARSRLKAQLEKGDVE